MGAFIHPKAIVETNNIGVGTRVWAFSHILPEAVIGKECNICDHTFIENDVQIGDRVTIKCGVYLWDGIKVENDAFIGPNATFTNDLKPRSKVYPENFNKIVIGTGASVGANATIIGGNSIGNYSMVGAGSVVTKDIPDYSLWYGNPAEFKAYICECGSRLDSNLYCTSCKKRYMKNSEGKVVKFIDGEL